MATNVIQGGIAGVRLSNDIWSDGADRVPPSLLEGFDELEADATVGA